MPPLAKRQRLDDMATLQARHPPPSAPRVSTRRGDHSIRAESPSSSSQQDEEAEEPDLEGGRGAEHRQQSAAGRPRRGVGPPRRDQSAVSTRRGSDSASIMMTAAADAGADAPRRAADGRGGAPSPFGPSADPLQDSRRDDRDAGEGGHGGAHVRGARSAPVSRRRSLEDDAVARSATEPPANALPGGAQLAGGHHPMRGDDDARGLAQPMVPWKTLETLLREAAATSGTAGAGGRDASASPALAAEPAAPLRMGPASASAIADAGAGEGGSQAGGHRTGWNDDAANGAAELQDRLRSSAGGGSGSLSRLPGSGGGSGVCTVSAHQCVPRHACGDDCARLGKRQSSALLRPRWNVLFLQTSIESYMNRI